MDSKWIAIVNRTEVRVYEAKEMRKIYTLTNNMGQEKNKSFTTDKPGVGRNRSLSKSSTHNLDGEKCPYDDAAKKFAHKINEFFRKRYEEHRFEKLLISAEDRMLGWVKGAMRTPLSNHVEWQHKDLVKFSDHELKELFLDREENWKQAQPPQSNS